MGLSTFFVLVLVGAGVSSAQGTAKGSALVGAWKIVETRNGPFTQPGVLVFTPRHYSLMVITSEGPRKQFADPAKVTPEEKAQAFDTLTAHSGTYQIVDGHIMFEVMIAKNPNRAQRGDLGSFKIEGQTLTISNEQTKAFVKYTRLE
jgi:hypothetical protein